MTVPSVLWAAADKSDENSRDIKLSFSASSFYQFSSNIDGGGDFNLANYHFDAGFKKQVSKEVGMGLGLSYDFDDYHFSGANHFGVNAPWNQVHRIGITIPITYAITDKGKILFVPSVQYSGESNSRTGDALLYGGTLTASYNFQPTLNLGVGVGVFSGLEKVRVFPYLVVNWQIAEDLRITNPFSAGPVGPAGLELSYNMDKSWEVGIGCAYRSYRFRLDEFGDYPNGIGEYRRIPVFARLSYKISTAAAFDLYGGASLANKLLLYDANGDKISSVKSNASPLVGATIKVSF